MKRSRELFRLTAILAAVGTLYTIYQRQKQQAVQKLRGGSQLISTASGWVEVAIQGQGTPVVVFHGGFGGYEQGTALAELLALDQCQIIAVSRPGYRQTPLRTGQTLSAQATAVADLLDALQIETAIVLAISAGGLSALQFAIDHPHRCAGLILLSAQGPTLQTMRPHPFWLWLMQLIMSADFLAWMITKVGMSALIRLIGNHPSAGQFDTFFWGIFPAADWRTGTMNDVTQLLAVTKMPLESIQCATLVIHGDHDVIVPFAVAQDSAKRIAHARLVPISTGTHLIMASHNNEIGEIVRQFSQFGGYDD